MKVKVDFKKNNFLKKDGQILEVYDVTIINQENGLNITFMDFGLTLPVNEYSFIIDDVSKLKKDDYGRYELGSYTLNAKYTFAFDILIKE